MTTDTPADRIDPLALLILELHTTPSVASIGRYATACGHDLNETEAQACLALVTEIGGAIRLLARIAAGLERVTVKGDGTEPRAPVWSDGFKFEPTEEGSLAKQIEMAEFLFPAAEREILTNAAKFYGDASELAAPGLTPVAQAQPEEPAVVSMTALRWGGHSGTYL